MTISLISTSALAWDDCPFGFKDEPYPGTCWRYVDKNNDGICDHSHSETVVLNPEGSSQQGYNSGNNIVTIQINPGKAIADCTLIEFPSELTLTLDLTGYSSGYVFVTIHYKFLETIYTNLSKLKLFYCFPTFFYLSY